MNIKTLFLLLISICCSCSLTFAQGKNLNKITKVELSQDKDSSKIKIGLTTTLYSNSSIMATLETVSFDLEAIPTSRFSSPSPISSDGFIKKVKWSSDSNKTSFEIKRQYYSPVNFIKQDKPPALIVELPRSYFNKESFNLKPGIVQYLIRTANERGPIAANVLEIDLSNENISVKVGLPNKEKIKSKDTLLNIVKNEMAYAGINANYFDVKVGNPLGTLITNGVWLVGPVYDRVAIGFSTDKKVYIDQVILLGSATVLRGFRKKPFTMFEIDGLNTPLHLYNKIGIFTSNWDNKLTIPENNAFYVVKKGCIKKIKDDSEVKIPDDGYVLVTKDSQYLNFLKKRDCIKINWQSNPDWSNIKEAISGGPYLIMNGEIYVDSLNQRIKFAKKETYAPRSAIGIDENNKLYLIAVDGRNNGYSVGLTLQELAELLKKLNLKEAINLDGGGSTTLVANEEIINKLSERHERKISNGLLIFYKD